MGEPDDDFFVGYLPMSARQSRFTWGAAALFVALVLGAGAAAAVFQRSPGDVAPFASGESITGLVVARPYPMLRTLEDDGSIRHVLLVRGGKFVWRPPPEAVDTVVTLSGGLLSRDGHRMLEVYGRDEAEAEPDQVAALRGVADEDLGEVTLVGEIVDSKCYLGRMRPGGGRTHRACAQLCVAGGIPPVLVTRARSGQETFYVLASEDGGSVARPVLPYVAEPVRVTGRLTRRADLNLLQIDPDAIERL